MPWLVWLGRAYGDVPQMGWPVGRLMAAGERPSNSITKGVDTHHRQCGGASLRDGSDEVARLGQAYREALAAELRDTPDCFGLQSAVEQSARRLVDALEAIDLDGLKWLGSFDSSVAEERLDEFVARFIDQVAHSVGLTVDAVVRRAAADAARNLLDRSAALRHAVETGSQDAVTVKIDDDLFCMIYRLFFADAVTGFLQSVIAAKIILMVPALPAVDPTGHITDWIAEQITSAVPTPCQKRTEHNGGPSLADLGRSLVEDAVERALGIPTDGPP
jgi:hypothetical protein